MRRGLLLLCTVVQWLLPHALHAEEASRYDALVARAVDEYNRENWGEARLLFARAHELNPNARTFRGIGLCEYESKRYVQAIAALSAALASGERPLNAGQRREVQGALEHAREYVASVALRLPAGVRELEIDGEAVALPADGNLLLNPGPHRLVVARAGERSLLRELDAAVGARITLVFADEEPEPRAPAATSGPTAEPKRRAAGGSGLLWTWVAGGATVALAGGTIAFGALAVDEHDRYVDQRAQGMGADEARRAGRRDQLIANAGIGVTAAAAVATLVLALIEGGQDARERASVHAAVGAGSLSVRARF